MDLLDLTLLWASSTISSNPMLRETIGDLGLLCRREGSKNLLLVLEREREEREHSAMGSVLSLWSLLGGRALSATPSDSRQDLTFFFNIYIYKGIY